MLTYTKKDYENRIEMYRSIFTDDEIGPIIEMEFTAWNEAADRDYGYIQRYRKDKAWREKRELYRRVKALQKLDWLEGRIEHYFDQRDSERHLEEFMLHCLEEEDRNYEKAREMLVFLIKEQQVIVKQAMEA